MDLRTPVVLRVVAIVCGALIALFFLWVAHAIFLIAFSGVLFGLALSPAVDFLQRARIPRGLGAALVLIAFVALLIGIGVIIGPKIRTQSMQIATQLPRLLQDAPLRAHIEGELDRATRFLFPIVSSVLGAAGGALIILFIAMYIAAEPLLYRDGILHLIPHARRDHARRVLTTLGASLRQWLLARLTAMAMVGTLTGLGLAALHIEGAVALGMLAGLLEFVPFFGPIASAIPAVGIALMQSPESALWVVGLYVLMQQLEGNVITPLLLERRLDVPPVLTLVGVAAMGIVFGVLGMLIAEPLIASTLVVTKMLYVQDVIGDEVHVGKAEST